MGSKVYSLVTGFKTIGFRVWTPEKPSQVILPAPLYLQGCGSPKRAPKCPRFCVHVGSQTQLAGLLGLAN